MRMSRTSRPVAWSVALFLGATSIWATVNKSSEGVALGGYDVVAYFTEHKALQGKVEFQTAWQGATWRFTSAGNRDLFAKEPGKYAPQYGGFCAYGVAQGHKAPVDPTAWRIVGGKLYLNFNREVQDLWVKDIPGNIKAADELWPKVGTE